MREILCFLELTEQSFNITEINLHKNGGIIEGEEKEDDEVFFHVQDLVSMLRNHGAQRISCEIYESDFIIHFHK